MKDDITALQQKLFLVECLHSQGMAIVLYHFAYRQVSSIFQRVTCPYRLYRCVSEIVIDRSSSEIKKDCFLDTYKSGFVPFPCHVTKSTTRSFVAIFQRLIEVVIREVFISAQQSRIKRTKKSLTCETAFCSSVHIKEFCQGEEAASSHLDAS